MDLNTGLSAHLEEIIQIRRHIHMYPELSEEETETAGYIASVLEKYQIPFRRTETGNGIVAQIGNPGNKCVGLRADIDALPVTEETGLPYASKKSGVMHACGHDMHTAILLGTGILLKELEDQLPGAVKLFFQPAEETIGGAKDMITDGCLENPKVTEVVALHVDPTTRSGDISLKYGPMNAASDEFSISIEGKACHGAHPEQGTDAIVIAAQVVSALQTISSRSFAPTTPVIVTIGQLHGGTKSNIVCGNVILSGTVRSLSADVMKEIRRLVEEISTKTAQAMGGDASVSWGANPYPPLVNDHRVSSILEQTARQILGDDHVHIRDAASLGADDFAFFTEKVPGVYFDLGTTAEGDPIYPLHSEKMAPDETAIEHGIRIMASAALKLLQE